MGRRIAFVALLAGCGPSFDPGAGSVRDGEEGEATGTSFLADASDGSTTTGVRVDVGSADASSGGVATSSGFIRDPDGESVNYECDLRAQDCPAGEKCNIWANDGGNSWNATKCVPIDPDPDAIGEPCTVVGSGVSGVDSCVLGSMCWYVDPETNLGECVAYCQGTENNPTCPDPETQCNNGREFALCVPLCCPLEQDCSEGDTCIPDHHGFTCVPDASGEMGAFGDPCEYVNACDPGLMCADASVVPGCEAYGCCTRLCAVGSSQCNVLHPDLECAPFYAPGQAPPGFEDIGACILPA